VYVRVPGTGFRKAAAIGGFMDEIARSQRLIRKTFKFSSDQDRALALGRFEDGRRAFGKLLEG